MPDGPAPEGGSGRGRSRAANVSACDPPLAGRLRTFRATSARGGGRPEVAAGPAATIPAASAESPWGTGSGGPNVVRGESLRVAPLSGASPSANPASQGRGRDRSCQTKLGATPLSTT